MYDAVVVGGGIVGASVGYHLDRAGADALLLDRSDPGRATDAGAGIVSPATSEYTDPTVHRFAIDAARYYADLIEALESDGVDEVGFGRPGILLVATADERAAFRRARDLIVENRDRAGYPPEGSITELDSGAVRELFTPSADVESALHYEDAGRVDGRVLNRALVRAGEANGLDARSESATGIVVDDGVTTGVQTDAGTIHARNVVIAGGAWSGSFAEELGIDVPIEPQRGQIVHLDAGSDAADWPIVKGFRDHYLVPWPDGRVAAGATREPDAGFAAEPTAAGVRTVLDEALRLAPGLADADFAEVRVGLRPASPDGRPVIGQAPVDGAYLATGHGPSGLTLGPYTGRVVADAVLGRGVDADLSPFRPDRFE